MAPNRFYVYWLIDPRDGKPFYVGKGSGKRAYSHVSEAMSNRFHNKNTQKLLRIREIVNSGNRVVTEIIKRELSERDALMFERKTIGGIGIKNLTNRMPGGGNHYITSRIAHAESMLARLKPYSVWEAEGNHGSEKKRIYDDFKRSVEELAAGRGGLELYPDVVFESGGDLPKHLMRVGRRS